MLWQMLSHKGWFCIACTLKKVFHELPGGFPPKREPPNAHFNTLSKPFDGMAGGSTTLNIACSMGW